MKRFVIVGLAVLLAGCPADDDTDSAGATTGGQQGEFLEDPPPECKTDTECVAKLSPAECSAASCVAGTCQSGFAAQGVTCSGEATGECRVMACDGAGKCADTAAPDGFVCGAVDACSARLCASGKCADAEKPACWDGNPCTTDGCDPATGCKFTANNDACDDKNPCTVGDACDEGFCAAGENVCECDVDADCADKDPDLCDGKMVCTEDQKCVNDPDQAVDCSTMPTDGLSACEGYECNPATGGCDVVVDSGAACDDGDACTDGDFCSDQGKCLSGFTIVCETNCTDEKDEDNDMATDCADDDCAEDEACKGDTTDGGTTGESTDGGTTGDGTTDGGGTGGDDTGGGTADGGSDTTG